MCGRYSFTPNPQALLEAFEGLELPADLEHSFNIAPSQKAWVITQTQPHELTRSIWGLVLPFEHQQKPDGKHINARSETVATKPLFQNAFRNARCLVPADSFYEWKVLTSKQKQPFRILRSDDKPLVFAGIYSRLDDLHSFSILTCSPNAEMSAVHSRMPVIFSSKDECRLWLSDAPEHDLTDLLKPAAAHTLRMYPVSQHLGSPQVNHQGLHDEVPQMKTLFD